ncbi:phage head closure protein [Paracoccus rhizosphaerae]|uniref:Phage head closure protein n=1 Tax=Paracoccus rhizosphaerae TaxID=1133347 RepID=A0ABV6CEW3_9RHOB|nr:phage head closure protein [Paracoccus rhizosphaerae]
MKAGKLTETITITTFQLFVNDYGTPERGSTPTVATVRAERIDQTTEEFLRGGGATDEETVVFRIRFVDGITSAGEVTWQGETFNIKQITPIGRRKGLDLRCVRLT